MILDLAVLPKYNYIFFGQKWTIFYQQLATFDQKLPKLAHFNQFLFNFDPFSGLNLVIVK